MKTDFIRTKLFEMRDEKYRDFQCKLIPTLNPDLMIGVRTPALRAFAKEINADPDAAEFLSDLPHKYFDENQLHAFIISEIKDFYVCINEVCRFLPFVDNWATCDQMSPKVFKKEKCELLEYIKRWISSGETYTVRFGLNMLMAHFLDAEFDEIYLDMAAEIKSKEYYVNMMFAWFFATALCKQYDAAVKYIENRRLDVWVHNKTIQKAIESYRIDGKRKEYLKSLKIKKQ